MEHRASPAPVNPVRRHEPRLSLAVAIVAIAVAVAIAKPWSSATSAAPASLGPPGPSPSDVLAATPVPGSGHPLGTAQTGGVIDLAGGGTLDCYAPPGWRLVVDTTGGGERVRTWLAVQPAPATGALDPTVPTATIANGPVRGLGFCAPRSNAADPASGAAWTASVWRIDGTDLRPAVARRVARIETEGGAGGLAPASVLPGSPASWASGRYAIQFEARSAALPDLWIVVDLAAAATDGNALAWSAGAGSG
jgi:hypothetical protein